MGTGLQPQPEADRTSRLPPPSSVTIAVAVLCCLGSLAVLLGIVTLGTWVAMSALP